MPLDSHIYDHEYFLSDLCEGYERFQCDRGLSPLKERLVAMLGPEPGRRVLDAGCGRGEVLLACARRGSSVAGIDYSEAAVALSRETLAEVDAADIRKGDVTSLPWADNTFDMGLLGDVIEHLDHVQARRAIAEMWRVLRPGGTLVVHTAPNRLFLCIGWPMTRVLLRITGHAATVKAVDSWIAESRRYHVNEQSVFGLRRALRRAGFRQVEAWIDPDILRGGAYHLTDEISSSAIGLVGARVAAMRPLRTFFGNDISATARKLSAQ